MVSVEVPAQVGAERIADGVSDRRTRCRDMMLEAAPADHMQQTLELGDLDHAVSAHVVGTSSVNRPSRRTRDRPSRSSVRRDVGERSGKRADEVPKVLLADGAGDNR